MLSLGGRETVCDLKNGKYTEAIIPIVKIHVQKAKDSIWLSFYTIIKFSFYTLLKIPILYENKIIRTPRY